MPLSVKIDDLREGMVLAEPVVNKYGQTLIPSGAELSSKHVNLLRTWNIFHVSVKSDNEENVNEISEELRQLAKERLDKKTDWKPRNLSEKNILELAILSIGKQIAGEK